MAQQEMNLGANDRQVGGSHYKKMRVIQHWDMVALFNLDYFQGNVTKYVMRWRDKNGFEDLQKAQHYLQKYIEIETARSNGTLTRQILERAILELEGIEQQEEQAAAYRAQAKGDDPVKDVLSGYPRDVRVAERGAPVPVLSAEENERRQPRCSCNDHPGSDQFCVAHKSDKRSEPKALAFDEQGPIFKKDLDADCLRDGVLRRKTCTHSSDDCPLHPNGGCPPAPTATPAP